MSAREIADQLVALCKEGKHDEVITQYYADDIVSVEACAMDSMPAEMKGIEAIKGKTEWWFNTFEVLDGNIDGPYMHGDDQFAVKFIYDVKNRQTGEQSHMEEIGVYTVKDGKIAHEAFFYTM